MKNKDKKEKNTNKRDNIFMIILSFCDVIAVTVLFLLYGPYNGFRDWLVTTAMGTMNHQYLATTFYNMDRIEEILSQHSTVEPDFDTDTSLITADENEYIDDYDREILDRNKNDIYKLIEIDEDGYSGYLAAVYDPSKIKVTYSKNLGVTGEYLVNMAKREGAVSLLMVEVLLMPEDKEMVVLQLELLYLEVKYLTFLMVQEVLMAVVL